MKRQPLRMKIPVAAFCAATGLAGGMPDGALLKAQVAKAYPSLRYVERYRRDFPAEAQGEAFWRPGAPPARITGERSLTLALAALEDQHVALVGAKAGRTETPGLLFRTAADGSVIVWRVFGPALGGAVEEGDQVLAIEGQDARAWLRRAAALAFGGQRRGRYAEAATELGLATAAVHRVAGLKGRVNLRLRRADGRELLVALPYRPMEGSLAQALSRAVDRPDLPDRFEEGGLRVATLRLGAFAPQYDEAFTAASDAASAKGAGDDAAMLAGYGAVVRAFIAKADGEAADADALVLDLRGNLGGFDREARLLADALAPEPSPATFDLFIGPRPGTVRLVEERRDPSAGHRASRTPLIVLTDAGTRSAGEFMASWLWASGAAVVGERTVGAGGGFEFGSADGIALPGCGGTVRVSGNFTLFDPAGVLRDGERPEGPLVDLVAQGGFAPSRSRPFAIQCAGLRPDLALATGLADLRDGGRAALVKALLTLKSEGRLR